MGMTPFLGYELQLNRLWSVMGLICRCLQHCSDFAFWLLSYWVNFYNKCAVLSSDAILFPLSQLHGWGLHFSFNFWVISLCVRDVLFLSSDTCKMNFSWLVHQAVISRSLPVPSVFLLLIMVSNEWVLMWTQFFRNLKLCFPPLGNEGKPWTSFGLCGF